MRHTAEWWSERLAELAETGDSRAIARRHGVRERTLLWWRSELRRRARTSEPSRLLPVVLASPARPATTHVAELDVFVEVGAARVTVRGALSAEHLAALVSASARAC